LIIINDPALIKPFARPVNARKHGLQVKGLRNTTTIFQRVVHTLFMVEQVLELIILKSYGFNKLGHKLCQ
jgi:hypothetical protein